MLDPQLAERPPDLRQDALRHLAARLRRMEIMAAPVGVERAEQALCGDRLDQAEKARDRSLLLNQDRRINLAGGVVERDDEIKQPLAQKPDVGRGVLMQHHAHHRPARPLAPMRPAPRRLGQQPTVLQIGLGPGIAPTKAMTANEMLVKMLGREAGVALPIKPPDLISLLLGNRPAGEPPEPPVQQPVLPLLLEPSRPAPERALAHSQQLGRFHLAQLRRIPAAQHVAKLQHPQALPLLRPTHDSLPKGKSCTGQITCYLDRTDRVLPTPRGLSG